MREPRRPRRRRDHLHLDAEPPRRDRVRLHRHAARRRALPDRHRHRVRPARPRLDPPARAGRHVTVEDVTSAYACLGLWGPKAREILQPLDDDAARLRLHARARARGRARSRASRSGSRTSASSAGSSTARPSSGSRCGTRSGRPGRDLGLVAGGYRAIDSLRLEKGYRVWGSDITPDDTPYEAGLGFAVKLDKGDFIGREALLAAQEPERRLCCLVLADPRAVALGSEPVRLDGARRRARHERRLRLLGRALDRLRLPARRDAPSPGSRSRSRSSASGSPARSRPSRCSTRPASASAHDRRASSSGSGRAASTSVEPLGGGITNHNFKVAADGEAFVLRIGGNDTELLGIDRTRRARGLAARRRRSGSAPTSSPFLEPEGYLVTRFVEGEAGAVTVRGGAAAAAPPARRGRAIPGRFDAFRVVETYAETAASAGVAPAAGFAAAKATADRIEAPSRRATSSCRATTTCSPRTSSAARPALDRRLGVRRHGRSRLRPRQLRRLERPRRGRRPASSSTPTAAATRRSTS